MKRLVVLAFVVVVTATIAVAVALGSTSLRVSAHKMLLKYNVSSLKADDGRVTITMTNPSVLPHNVAIKGKGINVKGKVVTKGGVSRVTAVLKPGKYVFYCSVPGHEAAGMKGVLTVS